MSICFLSLETSKVFNDLILQKLQSEGFDNLSSSLITIFPYIAENKNISISSLALKIGYSRQAMHKNLRKLETNDYIYFESLENKKEKVVSFTKKGENLMVAANAFIQSVQKEISDKLGFKELNQFVKSQQIIFDILNSKVND